MRDAGYPIKNLTSHAGKFYIENTNGEKEECGSYIGLNTAYKRKSANFGDNGYRNILYDEFIVTDPTKYLGTSKDFLREYIKCDELYVTVDRCIGRPRLNETNFIFLANMATYYNPLFIGLGIDKLLTPTTKILNPKGARWIVEQTESVKATEEIENNERTFTTTQQMLSRYNNSNVAFYDNYNLVEKITSPMQAVCNIAYKGHTMGVYIVKSDADIIYISPRDTTLKTIALTTGDLGAVNYMLPHSPEGYYYYHLIADHFAQGKVRFANRQCQYEVQTYMLMMPLTA